MAVKYECDGCGACCRQLIIEIDWIDVLREPALRQAAKPFKIPADMMLTDEDGKEVVTGDPFAPGALLACGATHACKLLGADNLCTIYPTRPNVCVGMMAGEEQCQQARAMAGLEPLQPVSKE
ncbi:MAG: YkgJ family cysteine cluster protein [Gemmataceae bacterium]|nr:YkgJ family cysteine cluster protein [Gemmataceae bacterium]